MKTSLKKRSFKTNYFQTVKVITFRQSCICKCVCVGGGGGVSLMRVFITPVYTDYAILLNSMEYKSVCVVSVQENIILKGAQQ